MPPKAAGTKPSKPLTSDEAVRAKTGRTWSEWFAFLDAADAAGLDHKGIVAILREAGVPPWWCQNVTVEYERARGLRTMNETTEGFQISLSKTVGVPVEALFAAFVDDEKRSGWIGDAEIAVHRATEFKSARAKRPEGHPVDLHFTAKGEAKSSVSIQQRKLTSPEAAEEMKAVWRNALGRLAEYLK